jgi:hypothetical protein
MDFSALVSGAGKGAAAGMALGPIGAAAGALLGAAPGLLDALGIHLFGSDGEAVAASAVAAVQAVTGIADPQPADVAGLPPDQMAQLRVQLAQIAAEREAAARANSLATFQAQLSDIKDARAQTAALVTQKSAIGWGAPLYSVMIVSLFGGAEYLAWHSTEMTANAVQIGIVETLKLLTVAVGSYWVGSSAGSKAKDDVIQAGQVALANSTPLR